MDGGAWWAAVNGLAKSRTQLSDLTDSHLPNADFSVLNRLIVSGSTYMKKVSADGIFDSQMLKGQRSLDIRSLKYAK